MPSQVTNYQCPACTGPLHFAGATGQLECEYCGSSYSVEEIEALYVEKEKRRWRLPDRQRRLQRRQKAVQQAQKAAAGQVQRNPPGICRD